MPTNASLPTVAERQLVRAEIATGLAESASRDPAVPAALGRDFWMHVARESAFAHACLQGATDREADDRARRLILAIALREDLVRDDVERAALQVVLCELKRDVLSSCADAL
ncbi:MAG: hypothetical protein ACYC3F_01100 [Gemmatimonadaceae bacterium]